MSPPTKPPPGASPPARYAMLPSGSPAIEPSSMLHRLVGTSSAKWLYTPSWVPAGAALRQVAAYPA